ncbi:MAG: hypothetical protein JSS87_08075 [Acidobacteria bacterium]|nr:hypothetical protein [Acidobacteriota bacterium]
MKFLRIAATLFLLPATLPAQHRSIAPAPVQENQDASHRTRLYLKDGSYQIVLSYHVQGSVVVYRSAERAGHQEEIPLELVDLIKTQSWAQLSDPNAPRTPILDPELAREERERTERVPEVAPNLHLPERESVLALDIFRGTPQLVPLTQTEGDLNRQTAHNIILQTINPFAHAHQLVEIKGQRASAQMHVDRPDFYIRVDSPQDADDEAPAGAFQVKTGAADRKPERVSPNSRYVIVQCDVRQDVRIVTSFETNLIGSGKMNQDVVETTQTLLPGGYWLKVVPKQPLLFGEYVLIEIINDQTLNLSVWDFGVHPAAPENRDAILPQERRKPRLETRGPR